MVEKTIENTMGETNMKKKFQKVRCTPLTLGLAIIAMPLMSVNKSHADSTDDLIRSLITKGVLNEVEGALLLKDHSFEKEAIVTKEQKQAHVEVGKKGIVVRSKDGDYSMAIGGRLHAEVMSHSNDQDLIERDDITEESGATDGTDIRRARIYFKGTASKNWNYMLEADLAGNSVSMKDVFGVYTGVDNWDFTFGAQKHAVSMEVQESSNDIMFTERGFTYALTTPYFDRALGVNAKVKGDTWNIQAGFYGDQFAPEKDGNIDEGYGYAIRGTHNPVWNEQQGNMIHLGASYGMRAVSNQTNKISGGGKGDFGYETTNGSNLKLLDTPDIDGLDEFEVVVLEFAAMNGPFSFQSEYAEADVKGAVEYDFTAWYATVGYTLTGEHRSYKPSDGEFKRLKPKNDFNSQQGTWGAFEVAARVDELDLNDNDLAGGDGKRYTLALNWYLNYNFRIMADYSRIYDIENGPVTKVDGSEAEDIDTFTLRTQWAF